MPIVFSKKTGKIKSKLRFKIRLNFMSEKQFEGKSAIVTGGTRGIGKAIVSGIGKARRECRV